MLQLFKVGDKVHGFCNGFFGRDSYEDKICTFVTIKYAVFENEEGEGYVLNQTDHLDKELVDGWKLDPFRNI